MGIQNFPAALLPIIQTGYLERTFQQALRSKLAYRLIADKESFSARIGETLTKTRAGLMPSVTTPLSPAGAAGMPTGSTTNLDNGLTPGGYGFEQYSIGINEYASTLNLNTMTDQVGIAAQFVQNVKNLGEQAARSLDELARNALFASYMGGNTRVRVTLGSAGPVVAVDDIRGFATSPVYGVPTAVSGGNPMLAIVGSSTYSVIGSTADGSNISTAPNGVSGTLTFSGNVTVPDGTAANAVVASIAPSVMRPNSRLSTAGLTAADKLTMATLLDAKAALEVNAVPRVDGFYHMYLDPVSSRQLFADADFKQLFQGATAESAAFRAGHLADPFLGMRFIPTTEAFVQAHPSISGAVVRRPIICGQGAIVEGTFAGMLNHPTATDVHDFTVVDSVAMVTREPLDRLGQNIAQSWYWVGGYAVPTDMSTNPTVVPTATNAAWKRAVVLEHV